jgi:hypothetical protein
MAVPSGWVQVAFDVADDWLRHDRPHGQAHVGDVASGERAAAVVGQFRFFTAVAVHSDGCSVGGEMDGGGGRGDGEVEVAEDVEGVGAHKVVAESGALSEADFGCVRRQHEHAVCGCSKDLFDGELRWLSGASETLPAAMTLLRLAWAPATV